MSSCSHPPPLLKTREKGALHYITLHYVTLCYVTITLWFTQSSVLHSYRQEREQLYFEYLHYIMLPYFGRRKQVTKVTFLVKEQNVSVNFH